MAEKQNKIGLLFEMDASQLVKGLKEAQQNIKLATSQFDHATAGLDNWRNSIVGLERKVTELTTKLKAQDNVVEILKEQYRRATVEQKNTEKTLKSLTAEYEQVAKEQGENSDSAKKLKEQIEQVTKAQDKNEAETVKLLISLNKAQASYKNIERQLKSYEGKLDTAKRAEESIENQIGQTSKTVDKANKEFAETTKTMINWAGNADGVKAKLKQLNTIIAEQEKTVNQLEKEYADLVKSENYTEESAKALKTQWQTQTKYLNSLKKDVGVYENQLKILDGTNEQNRNSTKNLNDSLRDLGDGFTVLKGTMANLLADGIKSLASGLANLAEESREYRKIMGSLEVSSQQAGYSADETASTYDQLFGVLADDQSSATTTANLQALGLEQDKLTEITNGVIGAWAKYGDSIPIDGLAEAINETSKTGKVTGQFADVLNWAGTNEDDFNKKLEACGSEAERTNLIMEELSRQGLMDAGKAWKENNKSLVEANKTQSEYQRSTAELGEKAEPIFTAVKQGFVDILNACLDLSNDESIATFTDKIKSGFSYFIENILPPLKEGLMWIVDHLPQITSLLIGLGTAFAVIKIGSFLSGIISLISQGKLLATVFGILKTAIAGIGGPWTLVIALIAGLVTGFITLWNTSDGFRNFFINIWEGIKTAVQTFVDAVVNFFTVTVPNAFSSFVAFLGNIVNSIVNFFTVTIPNGLNIMINWFAQLPSKIGGFISSVWSSVSSWASNMWNKAKELGTKFLNNIVNFFNKLPERIGYFIGFALGKIVSWGKNLISFATTKIPEFINKIVTFISQLPSKIWTWLQNAYNKVVQWGSNIIKTGRQKASDFISGVINYVKQLPSKIWTWLSNAVTKVVQWGSRMVSTGKEKASSFISSVINFIQQLPSKMWNWLSNAVSRVAEWGSNLASKGRQAGQELLTSIVEKVKEIPSKMLSIGRDIVEGVWNGIKGAGSWISGKIAGFADGLVSGFKDALGIKSPSRVMREAVGKFIPMGLGAGVEKYSKYAVDAVNSLVSEMTGLTDGALGGVKGVYNGLKGSLGTATGNLAFAGVPANGNSSVVNNFNQYNYSPKALSEAEIYRQSKNLINRKKG